MKRETSSFFIEIIVQKPYGSNIKRERIDEIEFNIKKKVPLFIWERKFLLFTFNRYQKKVLSIYYIKKVKRRYDMRKELGIYHNQYIEVTAEYMRVATTGGKVNILFRNVMHEGEEITDHVWIKMQDVRNSKQINEIKLKKHGIYKIRGKIYTYKKFSKESNKMVYDYCFKSVRIEMEV